MNVDEFIARHAKVFHASDRGAEARADFNAAFDRAVLEKLFQDLKRNHEMTEPRNKVTKQHIDDRITDVDYIRLPGTTVTICSITLENGFSSRGESACVDPAEYDEEKGKKYAYEKAFDKLWELEGYLLADERYRAARGDTNQFANEQDLLRYNLLMDVCQRLNVGTMEEIIPAIKRTVGRMSDFGTAITAMREGLKVARKGWNGKGMFVYLVPAASYVAQTGAAKDHFGTDNMVPYNAYLAIKNVNETVSTWVPSINDVLAEDWGVVRSCQL